MLAQTISKESTKEETVPSLISSLNTLRFNPIQHTQSDTYGAMPNLYTNQTKRSMHVTVDLHCE